MFNAVASPAKFTVVAVAFNRLNVIALVVISPPRTSKSPVIVSLLPTYKSPAMPTPPATCSAPLVELVAGIVLPTYTYPVSVIFSASFCTAAAEPSAILNLISEAVTEYFK
jgi:hypothetical protein